MKSHWIELKCYDVMQTFTNVEFRSVFFNLSHLVNSNLIWTCDEFWCTIHSISYIHHFAELFFVHSDFSLILLLTNDFCWLLDIPKELKCGYTWMFEPILRDFYWYFLSTKRLHPNVNYLWWWGPTPKYFKCKKVTASKCWLYVVVVTHVRIF